MVDGYNSKKKLKGSSDGFDTMRSRDGTVTSTAPNRSSGGIQSLRNKASSERLEQFKIIIVGESMVGKTTLIQRYIDNTFGDHDTQPTLSTDFKTKTVQLGTGDP